MSYQASQWAVRQLAGSAYAKAVLLVIAEAADTSGYAFLGYPEIGRRAEMSRRSVIDQVGVLTAAGLLKIDRRYDAQGHRTSNGLRLQIERTDLSAAVAPRDDPKVQPVHLGGDPYVHATTSLGAADDAPRCTPCTLTSFEPVKEPEGAKRPSRRKPDTPLLDGFPDAAAIAVARQMAAVEGKFLDLNREAESFRLHAEANDRRCRNWLAAWRMWINKGLARAPAGAIPFKVAETSEADAWKTRLRGWSRNGYWSEVDWGPKPGAAGCRVPHHLMVEGAAA